MLRCLIFICISKRTGCSAAWFSFAFLHELDAPLLDWSSLAFRHELVAPLLALHELDAPLPAPLLDCHLQFYMVNLMLRCLIFTCISTWTWGPAAWPSLAILHALDAPLLDLHELDAPLLAPLLDLHLQFYMNLMLRCLIFICVIRCTWCFAAWSWLRDLHLRFYMSWILRCLIFSCISTWTWCSPACSNLMLRCLLRCFTLTCTSKWWTWCSAPWSSFAFLHELDAPLLDLHLLFYMNLMLRCLILTCISTWTWCCAAWSSLAVPHELDAPLFDLHWQFYMNFFLRCLINIVAVRPPDRQTVAVRPSPLDRHVRPSPQAVPSDRRVRPSRHVTSRHVTSRRVASRHVTSGHVTSGHVTSRHVTVRPSPSPSDRHRPTVTWRHVTSPHVTSSDPVAHHARSSRCLHGWDVAAIHHRHEGQDAGIQRDQECARCREAAEVDLSIVHWVLWVLGRAPIAGWTIQGIAIRSDRHLPGSNADDEGGLLEQVACITFGQNLCTAERTQDSVNDRAVRSVQLRQDKSHQNNRGSRDQEPGRTTEGTGERPWEELQPRRGWNVVETSSSEEQ